MAISLDEKFDALYDELLNMGIDDGALDAVFSFARGIYGNNEDTLNNIHHWYIGGDFDWSDMVPSEDCPYYNTMHCECDCCIYR